MSSDATENTNGSTTETTTETTTDTTNGSTTETTNGSTTDTNTTTSTTSTTSTTNAASDAADSVTTTMEIGSVSDVLDELLVACEVGSNVNSTDKPARGTLNPSEIATRVEHVVPMVLSTYLGDILEAMGSRPRMGAFDGATLDTETIRVLSSLYAQYGNNPLVSMMMSNAEHIYAARGVLVALIKLDYSAFRDGWKELDPLNPVRSVLMLLLNADGTPSEVGEAEFKAASALLMSLIPSTEDPSMVADDAGISLASFMIADGATMASTGISLLHTLAEHVQSVRDIREAVVHPRVGTGASHAEEAHPSLEQVKSMEKKVESAVRSIDANTEKHGDKLDSVCAETHTLSGAVCGVRTMVGDTHAIAERLESTTTYIFWMQIAVVVLVLIAIAVIASKIKRPT